MHQHRSFPKRNSTGVQPSLLPTRFRYQSRKRCVLRLQLQGYSKTLTPNPHLKTTVRTKTLNLSKSQVPRFLCWSAAPRIPKGLVCMASSSVEEASSEQRQEQVTPRLQIYTTSDTVSPFWRDKYEREAKKYWDVFYKRHQDRFFKDRHYLDKEWGQYFSGAGRKVILEVGCGAGNTIFPLIETYTDSFVHACDFSPNAVNLVKRHKDFTESRVNAFVCDLTIDDLSKQIPPCSVDIVTMIFVLSAVSPEKMSLVVQNIRKILKPSGHVLFRDYATGDLAQERLNGKDQKISENFYARGDGTRAFYFPNEFLKSLFKENGFDVEALDVCCKQVENRSRELVMNRRWVQAVFCLSDGRNSSTNLEAIRTDNPDQEKNLHVNETFLKNPANDLEVDMNDGIAAEMFGLSTSSECDSEVIELELGGWTFKTKVLSKENQHACKSTGLMLWESARFMASVLARNQMIVAGKRVLELGSGCAGICSMIAARSADLVFATDGDTKALDLLKQNVISNLTAPILDKFTTRILEWGNKDHIEAIKEVNSEGFDIILGTDVTYIAEAILPLFQTAKELITSNTAKDVSRQPALILCHIFRRVDEPSILSAASQFGFKLVDKWPVEIPIDPSQSIIKSWFPENGAADVSMAPLNILYFQME